MDLLDTVKTGRVDGGGILSVAYYGGVVLKWDIASMSGLKSKSHIEFKGRRPFSSKVAIYRTFKKYCGKRQ